jgi:putative N-acetylmannosamine-6-phosphate epimerase
VTKITTRYVVRNQSGDELIVPSLSDLRALYAGGFLVDGADLVRRERSAEWTPVARFAALQGVRDGRRETPLRVAMVISVGMVLAVAIGLMITRLW